MSEISKDERIYRLANHIASSKNGLPEEWQPWADEIESDLRELAALRERAEPVGYRKLFTCSSCGAEGLDEPLESRCHCNGDGARWIEGRLYTALPAPVVRHINDPYADPDFDEPPAPVVPDEKFDEWSRRCEIQLTLCRPEFREVAEITWNACRAAMLAAPGKN